MCLRDFLCRAHLPLLTCQFGTLRRCCRVAARQPYSRSQIATGRVERSTYLPAPRASNPCAQALGLGFRVWRGGVCGAARMGDARQAASNHQGFMFTLLTWDLRNCAGAVARLPFGGVRGAGRLGDALSTPPLQAFSLTCCPDF